jgi:CDP-diacylglycerol--serine O-phosphatidyltransferase
MKLAVLTVAVLGILGLERLIVTLGTSTPGRQEWVRKHPILHPNSISFVRMPMGLISLLIWILGWQSLAFVWFSAWMISDLTDGTIARNCDLTTESGKWLDPLSDKLMYFPTLVYFAVVGTLDPWWVAALVVIDALGQASRLVATKKAANLFGKGKTALITVLLALASLRVICDLDFIGPRFLGLLTISCTILAFLSAYCKVVPDAWYANSLTLANLICGIGAIHQIFMGKPLVAFILVFVGQFFDLFDGRLARKFGSTTHGAVYDDVADATSFGLAISLVIARMLGGWYGGGVALVYFLCVVFRLVRFLHPPVTLPPGIFLGMPSPAGAMLAGAAVLSFAEASRGLATALVVLTCVLMVSNLRYRHFGRVMWPSLPNSIKVVGFVLFLIFVNQSLAADNRFTFTLLCFLMAAAYALVGLEWRRPVRA